MLKRLMLVKEYFTYEGYIVTIDNFVYQVTLSQIIYTNAFYHFCRKTFEFL